MYFVNHFPKESKGYKLCRENENGKILFDFIFLLITFSIFSVLSLFLFIITIFRLMKTKNQYEKSKCNDVSITASSE